MIDFLMKNFFRYLRIFSLAGILAFLSECTNTKTSDLRNELDQLTTRLVPDHRTVLFSAQLKQGENNSIILSGETTEAAIKAEIVNTLSKSGIKLIDSLLILPDTSVNKRFTGIITVSVANLRKHPDHAAEMVSQAVMGTPVRILKKEDSWMLIRTPDNYISWVPDASVAALTEKEMNSWKGSSRLIYTGNTGWIYSSADGRSSVTGDITGGCIVENIGTRGDFFEVAIPDNRHGYIEKNNAIDFDAWKATINCNGENICSSALSLTGIPYLWGGTSPKGVDCSGFVQSVFFRNGIILQRDASLQALHGSEVNISGGYNTLEKGDLLFFGASHHVTHVGIYIGNGEYINSSGLVVVNSLDSTSSKYSSYRKNSLICARKVIGCKGDAGIVAVKDHPWY
jgi:gamma-D-glutamyl-L-lysine dipeptidyl-peptidase